MRVPLAARLRPQSLDDIVGQGHLLAPGAPLRKIIEADIIPSIILYGPAGTGKTTIAQVISQTTKTDFVKLNATNASVKDIRNAGERGSQCVLFIDEIHRFTKSQQDALLPYVEDGRIVFIGASTENPFHSVNSPLISRSIIFQLNPLGATDLIKLIGKAIKYLKGNGYPNISITPEAAKLIIIRSCGDARRVISIIEVASSLTESVIDDKLISEIAPSKYIALSDDLHYDLASAFQGSIQASDPDAAIYWLAKWLESGEDIRFIARRLLIAASEDAFSNPMCVVVADAAYTAACEIGRPECDIPMAQATIMIATSKRDKTAAKAIWAAVADVRNNLNIEVPKALKDCHYAGAGDLGNGGYHDGTDQSQYVGIKKKYV